MNLRGNRKTIRALVAGIALIATGIGTSTPAFGYKEGVPQTLKANQWQHSMIDPYTTDNVGSGTPESQVLVDSSGQFNVYTADGSHPYGFIAVLRATSWHLGKDLSFMRFNNAKTADHVISVKVNKTTFERYHVVPLIPRGSSADNKNDKGRKGWALLSGWPLHTYGELESGLILNVSLYALDKNGNWAKDANTGLPKGAPAYVNTFKTGPLHVYSTATPATDCVITVVSGSLFLAGRTASGLVGALAPGQTGTYSAGMALLLDGETALLQGKKTEALDLFIDHHLESQTDAVKEQVWEQLKSELGTATKVGDKGIVTVNKIPFSFKVMKRFDGALGKASSAIDEFQTTFKNWQWISGVATKVCGS
jgi:hypothetical protein